MNNNNPLSNINPLALLLSASRITEAEIDKFADDVTDSILDESNGVKDLVLITALEKLCKSIGERLRARIDVRDGYDSIKGVGITTGNTGTRLNYEDDKEYASIKAILDARADLLKSAFKSISTEITDKKSGEVIPIVSVKTPNKVVIKLQFPKS